MIQIGLTVNQVGSKEVDKYVFVVGGCDDIENAPYKQKFPTALEIDPDIVTGTTSSWASDFMYIYKRATEISNDPTCWRWKDRTERDERNQEGLRGTRFCSVTTFSNTSTCGKGTDRPHEGRSA
jgi:hypothetical protein